MLFQSSDEPQVAAATVPEEPLGGALRVLVVAFQSGKKADGGLESLTQLVTRYRHTEVTLWTQVDSEKASRWRAAGHDVVLRPLPYAPGGTPHSGSARKLRTIFHHLAWNFAISWTAIREGVDVIHVNDPHALWHCAPALWLVGKPVMFNIRDTKPTVTRTERWKWRLAFFLSRTQVVLSREMAQFWSEVVSPWAQPNVQAVYSVVDPERHHRVSPTRRNELRKSAGLRAEDFVVGYFASFSPKKAQLELLQQLGKSLGRLPSRIKLAFIGDFDSADDPYCRACAEVVERHGLAERVLFLGYQANVHEWYSTVDLTLVATVNEGLARCMIESLASATPVVSFAVCSAREILEKPGEACGAVVPRGDYAGLLDWLRRTEQDERLLGQWRSWAHRRARRLFDARANTLAYENLYRHVAL